MICESVEHVLFGKFNQLKPMSRVIPLIMAGGSGTRLWPLSETNKPKQYHLILNNQMLLTQT